MDYSGSGPREISEVDFEHARVRRNPYALEAKAKAQGMSLHPALRAAILDWAKRAP